MSRALRHLENGRAAATLPPPTPPPPPQPPRTIHLSGRARQEKPGIHTHARRYVVAYRAFAATEVLLSIAWHHRDTVANQAADSLECGYYHNTARVSCACLCARARACYGMCACARQFIFRLVYYGFFYMYIRWRRNDRNSCPRFLDCRRTLRAPVHPTCPPRRRTMSPACHTRVRKTSARFVSLPARISFHTRARQYTQTHTHTQIFYRPSSSTLLLWSLSLLYSPYKNYYCVHSRSSMIAAHKISFTNAVHINYFSPGLHYYDRVVIVFPNFFFFLFYSRTLWHAGPGLWALAPRVTGPKKRARPRNGPLRSVRRFKW